VVPSSEEWLKKMDANRRHVKILLEATYGAAAHKWWVYWRTFFIAVAELFGHSNGEEWMVTHYLFKKK
jgi:(S)-coclaurine N-methyltransferase